MVPAFLVVVLARVPSCGYTHVSPIECTRTQSDLLSLRMRLQAQSLRQGVAASPSGSVTRSFQGGPTVPREVRGTVKAAMVNSVSVATQVGVGFL